MVAHAKGQEISIVPPLGGAMQSPEFMAISPMGRIPLLELDDGRRICESSAIAAYLEEVLPGPSLLAETAEERAMMRALEAIAQGEVGGGIRPVMVHRVFQVPGHDSLVDAGLAQIDKGMGALEKLLADGAYAVGNSLSLADCVLVPLLQLLVLIEPVAPVQPLKEAHLRLFSYLEGICAASPVAMRACNEMSEGAKALFARLSAPAA
jgi:glutathione S-transferase